MKKKKEKPLFSYSWEKKALKDSMVRHIENSAKRVGYYVEDFVYPPGHIMRDGDPLSRCCMNEMVFSFSTTDKEVAKVFADFLKNSGDNVMVTNVVQDSMGPNGRTVVEARIDYIKSSKPKKKRKK